MEYAHDPTHGRAPVTACSKFGSPRGRRLGRAPGRARSSSSGGNTWCSKPRPAAEAPMSRETEPSPEDGPSVAAFRADSPIPSACNCRATSPATRHRAERMRLSPSAPSVPPIPEDGSDSSEGDTWDDCASDFIGCLLAEAVEDYSDEAVRLVEALNNEAMKIEAPVSTASDKSCIDDESGEGNVAASIYSDYPDSECMEDSSDRTETRAHDQKSAFADYVRDMFDAAFNGNVLEFFDAGSMLGLATDVPDATTESLPELPPGQKNFLMQPCSRPSFRKRLRPRELPPGAEEFPMDCLPSAPTSLEAPKGPTMEAWAENMQLAALAEEVCLSLYFGHIEAASQLDDSFAQEEILPAEIVHEPVSPTVPRSEGRTGTRPRPSQQMAYDLHKPATPRLSGAPRIRRAGVGHAAINSAPFSSAGLQADTGSTPDVVDDEEIKKEEPATGALPFSATSVPMPPSGPAPVGRGCRPRSHLAMPPAKVPDTSVYVVLKGGAAHPIIPARPSSEMIPYTCPAAARKTLNLVTGGMQVAQTSKSAMEMDLAEETNEVVTRCADALLSKTAYNSSTAAGTFKFHTSSTKSSGMLPHISQQNWGHMASPRDTWKAHDVV